MLSSDKSKYLKVASSLRASIMESAYPPGSRLPTRTEMAAEFRVSNATIQKAFDTLAADGFIDSRPSGTFVASHPPHLCRYGLAMSARNQWSRMYAAVRQAAGMIRDERTRFVEYFVSPDVARRDDVNRLCADVSNRRLGGLIFLGASVLNDLAGTPSL
jgi:DNA-binding GntR family transcriptional regulator